MLRYGNSPKEPRYCALFQKADPPTLQEMFKTDLLNEQKVDLVLNTNERGDVVASAQRDSLVSMPEFESKAGGTLKRARQQEASTDMVELGGRLFEVVSVPVLISPENPIGRLTFGSELGKTAAEELRDIAQCQVALLASDQVVASTKAAPEFTREFVRLFKENAHAEKEPDFSNIKGIVLGDEHFFCSAGRFETSSAENGPGYLLLLSLRNDWQHYTQPQQTLLEMSALGTLLGAVVDLVAGAKAYRAFAGARDSAEAVGKETIRNRSR